MGPQCTEGTWHPSAPQQVLSRPTAELCLYTDGPRHVSEVSNPLFCPNLQRRFWKIRARKRRMDVLHSQPLELRYELGDSGLCPFLHKQRTTSPHLSCLFEKHGGAKRQSLPSSHSSSSGSGSDGCKPAPSRLGALLQSPGGTGLSPKMLLTDLIAPHKSLPSPILSSASSRAHRVREMARGPRSKSQPLGGTFLRVRRQSVSALSLWDHSASVAWSRRTSASGIRRSPLLRAPEPVLDVFRTAAGTRPKQPKHGLLPLAGSWVGRSPDWVRLGWIILGRSGILIQMWGGPGGLPPRLPK